MHEHIRSGVIEYCISHHLIVSLWGTISISRSRSAGEDQNFEYQISSLKLIFFFIENIIVLNRQEENKMLSWEPEVGRCEDYKSPGTYRSSHPITVLWILHNACEYKPITTSISDASMFTPCLTAQFAEQQKYHEFFSFEFCNFTVV